MKMHRFLPLIGVAIFAYVLLSFNLPDIMSRIAGSNYLIITAAVLIHIPILALKGLKWKLIVKSYGVNLGLGKSMVYWSIGYFIGLITPGRIGDFSRAYYIRDEVQFGRAMATVVVDRIVDLAVVFVLAILGAIAFVMFFAPQTTLILPITGLFIAFVAALFLFSRKNIMVRIVRPFFRLLVPLRYRQKMGNFVDDFYSGLDLILKRRRMLAFAVSLTVFYWLVTILQFFVFANAMGIQLSYTSLLTFMPIVILLDTLPISFSGIGTRDAALIFFFSCLAFTPAIAVAYSIILLFFSYVPPAAAGLVFWFKNPIKIKEITES